MTNTERRFTEYDPADFCSTCGDTADRPFTCIECATNRALDAAEDEFWFGTTPLSAYTDAEMDALDAYFTEAA